MGIRTIFSVAGLFVLASVSMAAVSDSFEGDTLNPAWTVVNPNPSSTVGLTGTGALNLLASGANGGSDMWDGSNNNAPRVLQAIDPAADWTVETKVTFTPSVDYQGVGILLSDNATATATASDLLRLGERSYAGDNGDVIQIMGSVVPGTTPDTYLRITKQGSGLTGWWSVDGTNWNLGGSSTLTQDWPYIGLYAIRQRWNSGADTSANFDYFLIPEPATMALLSVGALAMLRRRRK